MENTQKVVSIYVRGTVDMSPFGGSDIYYTLPSVERVKRKIMKRLDEERANGWRVVCKIGEFEENRGEKHIFLLEKLMAN